MKQWDGTLVFTDLLSFLGPIISHHLTSLMGYLLQKQAKELYKRWKNTGDMLYLRPTHLRLIHFVSHLSGIIAFAASVWGFFSVFYVESLILQKTRAVDTNIYAIRISDSGVSVFLKVDFTRIQESRSVPFLNGENCRI